MEAAIKFANSLVSMMILTITLLCIGCLVALISAFWTLALAFQRHVAWGLAVLLLPLANLAFLIVNWREARAPFFLGLASLIFMGAAVTTLPRDGGGLPFGSIAAMAKKSEEPEKSMAKQGMFAAKAEAEVQIKLASLKRKEDILLERKATLTPGDKEAARVLSEEIRQYNAELQPLLAQLKAKQQ
jgi:hypothetical protein